MAEKQNVEKQNVETHAVPILGTLKKIIFKIDVKISENVMKKGVEVYTWELTNVVDAADVARLFSDASRKIGAPKDFTLTEALNRQLRTQARNMTATALKAKDNTLAQARKVSGTLDATRKADMDAEMKAILAKYSK